MNRIILLSTDTLHHRYFLNSLLDAGIAIEAVCFERERASPPFHTVQPSESEEQAFEEENFFVETRRGLERFEVINVGSGNGTYMRPLLHCVNKV